MTTAAAAATAKPFNMLNALAEGFKSKTDAAKGTVTADTVGLATSKPVTIQHVALAALSEHTGSSWVMPQVNGIPFTCPKMVDWSEEITEQPPILRLEHARMELVASDPDNKGYRIRIIDGRAMILEALNGILLTDIIIREIFPFYTRMPTPQIDQYYFRDDPNERHAIPCFELSYFPSWKPQRPTEDPAVTRSIQRIKADMAIKKATPCDTSSHFEGLAIPWIQYNASTERVMAHVVIGGSEFLLVNNLDLDSVQKYALLPPSSTVSKKQTIRLDYEAMGSYEPIDFGYYISSFSKKCVAPLLTDDSVVLQSIKENL